MGFDEEARNKSDLNQNNDNNNDEGTTSTLKLLIPNDSAGALIGKGGSNLSDLQKSLECKIRLSKNGEHYPGTNERIVLITAAKDHLIECNNLIMEKIVATEDRNNDPMRLLQVKMVLTDEATGLLIGRGGSTIQAIQESSKAKLNIVRRSDAAVTGERVLTVFGSIEERYIACRQIIEKIASEYGDLSNANVNYSANENTSVAKSLTRNESRLVNDTISSRLNIDSTSGLNSLTVLPSPKFKTTVKLEVEVPTVLLSSLLGTMSEIARFSGTSMYLSAADDLVKSPAERVLTVVGGMNETHTAYFLISQKIEQAENELLRSR